MGRQVANTTQQLADLLAAASTSRQQRSTLQLQPFDHILAPAGATAQAMQAQLEEGTARLAVLYGAIGTACFEQLHAHLLAVAAEGEAVTLSLQRYDAHTALRQPPNLLLSTQIDQRAEPGRGWLQPAQC